MNVCALSFPSLFSWPLHQQMLTVIPATPQTNVAWWSGVPWSWVHQALSLKPTLPVSSRGNPECLSAKLRYSVVVQFGIITHLKALTLKSEDQQSEREGGKGF